MLTREEIRSVYEQGPEAIIALIAGLCTQLTELTARVKELEDRLTLNSHNSSKPPSSDPPAKHTRSSRTPSGKKPGAQPGHLGTTLKSVETPDHVVHHAPDACADCGAALSEVPGVETANRRQVFDLPPLKLEVTEHRVLEKTCPRCGRVSGGEFPATVTPGTQYGEGIKAVAVYLITYQLLPWQRACELLGDLVHQPIAEGTLHAALQRCAAGLSEVEEALKRAITQAGVGHFDETGLYVADQRQWLHVSRTAHWTHYAVHPQRGAAATAEIGILPQFHGRAMHDAVAAYFGYQCEHALCNAHHLRELTFVHEQMGQAWAGAMKNLLLEIKQAVEHAQAASATSLPGALYQQFEAAYVHLLNEGLQLADNQPPPPTGQRGRRKQSKAKNLLDRLSKYRRETLAFMYDFRVPFDNNLAERDLRMIKVQQKVSGCFRTIAGAKVFCRLRGYISPMKKQGQHVLTALKSVFTGQPVMPALQG
jgi:transposase